MGGERRGEGEKIEKKARRLKKGTKEKKLIKGERENGRKGWDPEKKKRRKGKRK